MGRDWMKLHVDCSWKRLQTVAFRGVGGPQDLTLIVSAGSGERLLELTEEFTCNPTWEIPQVPHEAYPLRLDLQSADGSSLWSEIVDFRRLYYVTSDLKDLERTRGLALLLHFRDDAYYTIESLAEIVCEAARSNNDQIKILGTRWAQAREVDFGKLQQSYAQYLPRRLFSSRATLSELSYRISESKEKIASIVRILHVPGAGNLLRCKAQAHFAAHASQVLKTHSSSALVLKQDLDGQQEIAENFLRAHVKKLNERLAHIQGERRVLEAKERLLVARKMKMLAEMYSVFEPQIVLNGFLLLEKISAAVEKDAEVSTALGYACLILLSLQSYLSIRLQYPLKFQGSRSSLFVGDKEFPLYAVGKSTDRVKLDQAVRYLTQNLRQTLKALGHSGDVEFTQTVKQLLEQLRKFRG